MLSFKHKTRNKYGNIISKSVVNFFNTSKKIVKLELDIKYLETCMNNEVLPDFTRLNLASSHQQANKRFTSGIRAEITNEELRVKKSLVRKYRNELSSLRNSVHFDLDPYEWTHLQDLVNEKKTKLTEIITAVHRKKLLKLGVSLPKNAQDNNVTTRRNTKLVTSDAVHNKSNRELSNIETLVLEKHYVLESETKR